MTRLEEAEIRSKELGPLALYYGAWAGPGHHLRQVSGTSVRSSERLQLGVYWDTSLMDGGLLNNGEHPDVVDGKVFRTGGGLVFWHAFYWWDRSGDRRAASNSGFYVRGFKNMDYLAAFAFACKSFPHIIKRQRHPLVLQD